MILSLYHLLILTSLVGITLYIIFFFKKPPKNHPSSQIKLSRDQLKKIKADQQNWGLKALLIWMIVVVPLFTYLVSGKLMGFFTHIQMSYFPEDKYFLRDGLLGGLPTIFFAMISAFIVFPFLFKIKQGKEYAQSTYWARQKKDLNPFMKIYFFIIIPLYINLMILSLDSYARVTDKEFIINPYFGFTEKKYPFNEIQDMFKFTYHTRYGWNQAYMIQFKDGNQYDFSQTVNHLNLATQAEVVNYLFSQIPRP